MRVCEQCLKDFEQKTYGRAPRFCSRVCRANWHGSRPCELTCPSCGKITLTTKKYAREFKAKGGVCRNCSSDKLSGPASATWKGGHRHWSPGRFGRDKDGLSWKAQRRLAWERDKFTCQECGTKPKRNPDVHHIIPFRVSQSHALKNLKCLCQKCHMQEETKVQEQWGGRLGQCPVKEKPALPKCCFCQKDMSKRHKVVLVGGERSCIPCERLRLVNLAVTLRSQDVTVTEIARRFGCSLGSAHYYSTGKLSNEGRLPHQTTVPMQQPVTAPGPYPGVFDCEGSVPHGLPAIPPELREAEAPAQCAFKSHRGDQLC